MSKESYHEQNKVFQRRFREQIDEFPEYIQDFFADLDTHVNPNTKYVYMIDLKCFYNFLLDTDNNMETYKDITPDYLDKLQRRDFNYYLASLKESGFQEKAVARKLPVIRALYTYLNDEGLTNNAAYTTIRTPKPPKKDYVEHLDTEEQKALINAVESGHTLPKSALPYHDKQMLRDLTIITLIMGTGLRVSECVGLDIQDVDLNKNQLHIMRKGNKEMRIYFPEKVKEYLEEYMEERLNNPVYKPEKGHENALFISRKHTRMSARSVERLVKKYATPEVVGTKDIHTHTLRATYGTSLYDKTDDLYVVAEVLGHSSVDTSKIYANMSEERKKRAGKIETW